MRLIDANVFIYASGTEHEYKEPCLRLLRRVQDGELEANTDAEVVQELLHYYHSRRTTELGVGVAESALTQFPEAFAIDVDVMGMAARVLRQYSHLQSRDAVHAAVVLRFGLEGIFSADSGFDEIAGVKRFDPKELT